jgi:hypothetical protein
MVEASNITEHMEVVSSDGRHIGRVDHIKGAEIELARFDMTAMGKHHMIPLSWVEYVDDKVHLNLDHDQTKERWTEQ